MSDREERGHHRPEPARGRLIAARTAEMLCDTAAFVLAAIGVVTLVRTGLNAPDTPVAQTLFIGAAVGVLPLLLAALAGWVVGPLLTRLIAGGALPPARSGGGGGSGGGFDSGGGGGAGDGGGGGGGS